MVMGKEGDNSKGTQGCSSTTACQSLSLWPARLDALWPQGHVASCTEHSSKLQQGPGPCRRRKGSSDPRSQTLCSLRLSEVARTHPKQRSPECSSVRQQASSLLPDRKSSRTRTAHCHHNTFGVADQGQTSLLTLASRGGRLLLVGECILQWKLMSSSMNDYEGRPRKPNWRKRNTCILLGVLEADYLPRPTKVSKTHLRKMTWKANMHNER